MSASLIGILVKRKAPYEIGPFHDYEAWSKLKQLQECGFGVPVITDPNLERKQIEDALRTQFQAE